MSERTVCSRCGREILMQTAAAFAGLCALCDRRQREAAASGKPPPEDLGEMFAVIYAPSAVPTVDFAEVRARLDHALRGTGLGMVMTEGTVEDGPQATITVAVTRWADRESAYALVVACFDAMPAFEHVRVTIYQWPGCMKAALRDGAGGQQPPT